jgi:hypothetical protein
LANVINQSPFMNWDHSSTARPGLVLVVIFGALGPVVVAAKVALYFLGLETTPPLGPMRWLRY